MKTQKRQLMWQGMLFLFGLIMGLLEQHRSYGGH